MTQATIPSSVIALFDLAYVLLYAFFMYTYFHMQSRPSTFYISGVLLYLLGYMVFMVLTYTSTTDTAFDDNFYTIGSSLFAVGSLLLVYATVGPWPRGSVCSCLQQLFFSKPWALCWGSLFFFAGSVMFTYDSFVSAPHHSVIGYVLFVGGRIAFLWGSTTDEVNWLLQRTPGTRKRGPTL